jgi:hypothetical protein
VLFGSGISQLMCNQSTKLRENVMSQHTGDKDVTESSQWFVRKGEKTHGPFTSRQLKKHAAQSKIKPDTDVRKGEVGSWMAASTIKGLFPTELASETKHKPPTVQEQSPPVVEPVPSIPVTQLNTGHLTLGWKPIAAAVVAVILVSVLFAAYFPWLALLLAIILLAGGIGFAVWPPMSERIAHLRSRQRPSVRQRIYVAVPLVLCGVTLLALSQSQIRSGWNATEVRVEVAREIMDANSALDRGDVDEAITICNLLDSKANTEEKSQVAAIRARVETLQHSNRVKAANTTVRQLLLDCKQHYMSRQLDEAQLVLKTAVQTPFATEFLNASELADSIVAGMTRLAQKCLDEGDTAGAKEHAAKAILVSSATKTVGAKRIITEIANREVAALVASARTSLAKMHRDEAATSLESALAIADATEIDEAKKLLAEIRESRATEADARVATLMTDAQRAISAEEFDNALRTLNIAAVVAHSTKQTEVNAMIQTVQRAKRTADETQKRQELAAMEREERAVREWYKGGTLHNKSALEWQLASSPDKLATCADFVTKMWNNGDLKPSLENRLSTVDNVRPYAQELVECLDAAFKRDPNPEQNRKLFVNQTVASTAVICMVTMGWPK